MTDLTFRVVTGLSGRLVLYALVDEDVAPPLEEPIEGFVRHFDAGEPLHRRHAIPPGHQQTNGKAVVGCQRLAVHLVGEKQFRSHGRSKRQASGVGKFSGVYDPVFLFFPLVRSVEHHFQGFLRRARLLQNLREGDALPPGRAHRAVGEPNALRRRRQVGAGCFRRTPA